MALNDPKRRDFVSQMIQLMENERTEMISKGYDPTNRISQLKDLNTLADQKEMAQQKMAAEAKAATAESKAALMEAYNEASAVVDLVSGILGKNDEMVQQMRKFRK